MARDLRLKSTHDPIAFVELLDVLSMSMRSSVPRFFPKVVCVGWWAEPVSVQILSLQSDDRHNMKLRIIHHSRPDFKTRARIKLAMTTTAILETSSQKHLNSAPNTKWSELRSRRRCTESGSIVRSQTAVTKLLKSWEASDAHSITTSRAKLDQSI